MCIRDSDMDFEGPEQDSVLLFDQIDGQLEATQDQGEKLTWAAVRNLRQQQHELNSKMD